MSLAFLFLCRIKNLESLRYSSPGEWGKILGLDRMPEVKTLRQKIEIIGKRCDIDTWSHDLVEYWLGEKAESDGIFYVDGHTRVYSGDQTKLPKHYVARQKLCLRATSDYWVNAMDGVPFFYINKAVDPGLISVIENDILLKVNDIFPLDNFLTNSKNPNEHRFTFVFDREGYSPDFFLRMKQKRIAIISYKKNDKELWPVEEFTLTKVNIIGDEITSEIMLAERGTFLADKLWVREIRKLTASGHQTTVLSTNFIDDFSTIARIMFARWSQENFFKYMREEYGLDKLYTYQKEEIDATTKIVNPAYRDVTSKIKSRASKLIRLRSKLSTMNIDGSLDEIKLEKHEAKKAELLTQINELQTDLDDLKVKRKEIKNHITVAELPEELQFKQLETKSRKFLDTVKMIAYRAEHSLANMIKPYMTRPDEAKVLLKSLFQTSADIIPDQQNKILLVRIHDLANKANNTVIEKLCLELNECAIQFPRSDLVVKYQLVSKPNP